MDICGVIVREHNIWGLTTKHPAFGRTVFKIPLLVHALEQQAQFRKNKIKGQKMLKVIVAITHVQWEANYLFEKHLFVVVVPYQYANVSLMVLESHNS